MVNKQDIEQDVTLKRIVRFGQAIDFPESELDLLIQAFTHPTFFEGQKQDSPEDNQRLEFLGDAVVDMVAGAYLYNRYPEMREGDLSKMRAAVVCEQSLAKEALNLGIGSLLRLGKGAEVGGDRNRPSVLADAFEALIGALYQAAGFAKAEAFVLKHFKEQMDSLTRDDFEDKKSMLQELVQKESGYGVTYRLLKMDGPDHAPTFASAAYCRYQMLGRGEGGSKKESEQAAAAAALKSQGDWLPKIRKQ